MQSSHIVVFGKIDGLQGKIERNCKISLISNEEDLRDILTNEAVDLVLIADKYKRTVNTIRTNPYQGDIPILLVGKKERIEEIEDDGCTDYISLSDSLSTICSNISNYLSIGKLLSSAKRAYNKTSWNY